MSSLISQPIDTSIISVIESNNMQNQDTSYKEENLEQNTFPVSDVSNDNNAIQCYMNQDNTLSFVNNTNVYQTVDDCGDIYFACIGSTNDANQDQVLQLIPQNQISNYIISDKVYPNVNFVNDSSVLNGNNYYDSNVFKSINIGKQLCEICSLEFPSKRTYLKHMSIHENDREFKCSWCKLSYNYEVNLLVHIAIIHTNECTVINEIDQETNYKCAICSCIFTRKKAHQAHCLIHQVDEELPCEHCSLLFKCKILLEKHLNDHKVGNECPDSKLATNYLKCKICHQMFNNVGNMKKHYIQFHPKNKSQWDEDVLEPKLDDSLLSETNQNIETSNKRKSSKLASQTIKLYAQGKAKSNQEKFDCSNSLTKRGRPKKTESKSPKDNSNCKVCNKSFKTPILLRRHEVTHTGVKEFECPVCKKGFTQKSSVKIHMAVHDSVKGFCCQYCLKTFTYEHNMNTHIKVIHKNNNILPTPTPTKSKPDVVVRVVSSNSTITTLQLTATGLMESVKGEAAPDTVINDDAEISQYLWTENPVDHQGAETICYQPNQSINGIYKPSTPSLTKIDWDKSHQVGENRGILLSEDIERLDKETGQMQVHEVIKDQITGFKRFRCRFCFKLYRKSCDLSRHIRIHNQQRPFQCYMCHKSFRLKSVLKNHFKSHWKLKEYSCDVCHKIFNLKQTLKVHRQLHEPSKLKFMCKLCNKRFNTSFHFQYHMKNHNHQDQRDEPVEEPPTTVEPIVEAPEPITNLVKTFMWNDLLNQPMLLTDPAERRRSNGTHFKCNHCGKSYKFKKYLNEHLKDHLSANKTNICHFCNKTFLTFRSMQQHLRTQHLNRRKFLCSQCPAFFITKASLIRHGLVHSNSKPYACSLCFRRFKAKIYCDRHVAAMKCFRKTKREYVSERALDNQNTTVLHLFNEPNPMESEPIETEILTTTQPEPFQNFHLEDLDMNTSQASNILVTNYVNEYSSFPSSDKYMIVSLDGQATKDSVPSVQHQQEQHYINSCGPGASGTGYYSSNMLMDDSAMVDIARTHVEPGSHSNENLMGLLDGQLTVAPIDLGSIFNVQNYNSNIGSLSGAQLIDPRHSQTGDDLEYSRQVPTTGAMHSDNVYYYQPVSEVPTSDCVQEPVKGCLADKFPILKASLFSEDECSESNPQGNPDIYTQSVENVTNNQFIVNGSNSPPLLTGISAEATVRSRHNYHHDTTVVQRLYHGCANCDDEFPNSDVLSAHVKTAHKIRKDFVCNVCHKAFSAKLSLWAHSKTHIDSRSFGCLVCIACNQRFISVPSLSRHVRMQHNDNLNLYRCTHCNRVYKTTRELDSHVKQLVSDYDALIINSSLVENHEPPINALEPPSSIFSSSRRTRKPGDVDLDKTHFIGLDSAQIDHIASLDVNNISKLSLKELIKAAKASKFKHKSTTTNDCHQPVVIDTLLSYPYSCSICHKGFNRASNLQQHLSVHTKLKPYQCSKCSNRFRHRCSLKTHEATKHSPVTKLLRCHLCLKLLRSQVALSNHMKIHVRTYNFHCELCNKGFQTNQEKLKHVKLKHCKPEEQPTRSDDKSQNIPMVQSNPPKKETVVEIPKKLIKCLSCSFIFNTRSKYNNHYCVYMNSLKPDQTLPNTCCGVTFGTTQELLSHMGKVHNQTVQYNCAQCNIMFAEESSFVSHQKSVHHL